MSLRERKKERTRASIVASALGLFGRQGYAGTTVTEIAASAEIGRRTFFEYFAAKEDVVFDDLRVLLASLDAALAARPDDRPVIDVVTVWLTALVDADEAGGERARAIRRLIAGSPELQAHERRLLAGAEGTLARHLAPELGVPPDHPRPRMVAAAMTAALGALGTATHELPEPERVARMRRGGEDLLRFVGAGLEALRP